MKRRDFTGTVVVITGIDRNALGGDGAAVRHAQQIVGERARPEDIAVQVLRAAERGTRLLLPGRTSKLAWWVSRIAQRRYACAMARLLRGEMDGGQAGSGAGQRGSQ